MTFRPHDVPPHAECLDVMACMKTDKVPSRFAVGCTAIVTQLRCPACNEVQRDPGRGTRAVCPKCRLFMHVDGDHVFVWRQQRARFGGGARVATAATVLIVVCAGALLAAHVAPEPARVSSAAAMAGKDQSRMPVWRMQP